MRLNATQYFIMKIRNVSKYKFLTGKNVLPEKDLLENAATMKRFKYSPLGKEFKAETDIAKKPYQKLDDTFGGRWSMGHLIICRWVGGWWSVGWWTYQWVGVLVLIQSVVGGPWSVVSGSMEGLSMSRWSVVDGRWFCNTICIRIYQLA